jgi:hypothetical protein
LNWSFPSIIGFVWRTGAQQMATASANDLLGAMNDPPRLQPRR